MNNMANLFHIILSRSLRVYLTSRYSLVLLDFYEVKQGSSFTEKKVIYLIVLPYACLYFVLINYQLCKYIVFLQRRNSLCFLFPFPSQYFICGTLISSIWTSRFRFEPCLFHQIIIIIQNNNWGVSIEPMQNSSICFLIVCRF